MKCGGGDVDFKCMVVVWCPVGRLMDLIVRKLSL